MVVPSVPSEGKIGSGAEIDGPGVGSLIDGAAHAENGVLGVYAKALPAQSGKGQGLGDQVMKDEHAHL